ncbi:hypothetical protein WL88_19925 [Burkholderia diffusa]|uniref:Uncharacterized protein n=1 Tax=Burkholderia diffusa TaxID=488732 RepID=A0AAW3PD47_9BURK|nr:hypothetical protein WL85_22930 [Burkholderia diffusa]KWF35853.1 hypothetical protein WL86_20405 [Burkholderia diffusa]KWF45215.1 hypothetical protein WL87_21755 [Burkholderia diffusa]KWF50810.1 hypothetical protein WL88_19925 [Burkholderia diffusa]
MVAGITVMAGITIIIGIGIDAFRLGWLMTPSGSDQPIDPDCREPQLRVSCDFGTHPGILTTSHSASNPEPMSHGLERSQMETAGI